MGNDFIEGMQILINCKRYVEDRIDYLDKRIEEMNRCGKDTEALQQEVNRLLRVLGEKSFYPCNED